MKPFTGTKKGIRVSFWLKNSFHTGGITQVFAFHPSHGATLLGSCPPHTPWKYYSFQNLGEFNELRFYFVDITDLNTLYLDSIELYTGECTETVVPTGGFLLALIPLLMIKVRIRSCRNM
jgi:hypothetical protein